MKRQGYSCSPPKKKRPKKSNDVKKLGIAMLLLGISTILMLFLPMKYWVLLLSVALMVFGILLIKK